MVHESTYKMVLFRVAKVFYDEEDHFRTEKACLHEDKNEVIVRGTRIIGALGTIDQTKIINAFEFSSKIKRYLYEKYGVVVITYPVATEEGLRFKCLLRKNITEEYVGTFKEEYECAIRAAVYYKEKIDAEN